MNYPNKKNGKRNSFKDYKYNMRLIHKLMEEKVFGPHDSSTSERLLKKIYMNRRWVNNNKKKKYKLSKFRISIRKKTSLSWYAKDQRYNELLKEIQLKELHIQSLEKLIGKENNDLNLNNNTNNINNLKSNYDNTFNNNLFAQSNQIFNQGTSFVKDEEIERRFYKMINNFDNNDYNYIIKSKFRKY